MNGNSGEEPTLYRWAGGEAAFARMINTFYDRVERDELLAGFFPGGVGAEHRRHVIAWWCEVFGGPATYTEQYGGYEQMVAHHRDLDIRPEQRLRFATLMSEAADDAQLPDDPEFRAALVGYLEWDPPRRGQLAARSPGGRTRARPAVGLGRGTALPALIRSAGRFPGCHAAP